MCVAGSKVSVFLFVLCIYSCLHSALVRVHICALVCMYGYVHKICMHTYMHMHMYIIYIYIYICIYIHTYIHIHMEREREREYRYMCMYVCVYMYFSFGMHAFVQCRRRRVYSWVGTVYICVCMYVCIHSVLVCVHAH